MNTNMSKNFIALKSRAESASLYSTQGRTGAKHGLGVFPWSAHSLDKAFLWGSESLFRANFMQVMRHYNTFSKL